MRKKHRSLVDRLDYSDRLITDAGKELLNIARRKELLIPIISLIWTAIASLFGSY